MIKLSKEDFIEELIVEMEGYIEITDEHKIALLNHIEQYIEKEKDKNKRISKEANSITINLNDETELFEIVDNYLSAIINDELEQYWLNWSL